jgi:diguanylate cyclase (GGDEF)-like protein/PAS domain S-box-containing protein
LRYPFLKTYSISAIILFVTTLIVTISMGIYSLYLYQESKKKLTKELKNNSALVISSMQKSLAHFIESYKVNEYEILLRKEMQNGDFNAIIINDFNMASILSQPSFLNGKIRRPYGDIVTFDPKNPKDLEVLSSSFYQEQRSIYSSKHKEIATITLYSSDRYIQQRLNQLLLQQLLSSIILIILLLLMIFYLLKDLVLRPLLSIIGVVTHLDNDAIPISKVKRYPTIELNLLSKKINEMIDAIRRLRRNEHKMMQEIDREKNRFLLAIEGSKDGLWDWNPQTNEVFYSAQWRALLGYREEEIEGSFCEWRDRIHPQDLQKALHDISQYLKQKSPLYESKYRLRCKDGSWKWILGRGKALFDEKGEATRFIGFHTDITKQIEHEKDLEYSAKHDSLTGLPNRFLFGEMIQKMYKEANKGHKSLFLLYIDLDGFKKINDTYGHHAGDLVLIEIAHRMKAFNNSEALIARLGGDEFVLAHLGEEDRGEIVTFIQRLIEHINQPIPFYHKGKQHLHVAASIGVSFYQQNTSLDAETLLRQADKAMYEAKNRGKNHFVFFDKSIDQAIHTYKDQLQALYRALYQEQLLLYYQPKVDMRRGQTIGFEALLRWEHPKRGIITPEEFLSPFVQEKALMIAVGQWVLKEAIKQLSIWNAEGFNKHLSINLSIHEICSDNTLQLLLELLEKYPNVQANSIELELLETSTLNSLERLSTMIQKYQSYGFSIAIDDFGTGYSTLSYLKDLPVDTLKIDKSFVMEMLTNQGSYSIVKASLALAKAFECGVVAEGVSSQEHIAKLLEMGCNIGQGYALSKPLDVKDIHIKEG